MLNLLKASSKTINPHKKRKIIPLLGSIKNFHEASQQIANQSKQKQQQDNAIFTIGTGSEIAGDESEMN